MLIQHLPQLEKGIVDSAFEKKSSTHLSPVDNSTITSSDLVNSYKEMFGEMPAPQLKQLHIAKEEKLEAQLNEEGYAVIDFLNEPEVASFKLEYFKHFGQIDKTPGRFTTLQDTGNLMKKQMHSFIVQTVNPAMCRHFKDFVIPVSQFYVKKAFTSGDIDLHADSSLLLNHQLEPHYAIWVPLIDVDANNGTLTVIPRSHKVSRAFFGASFEGYHQEHLEWLRQFEIPVVLRAGQAIIFDNNLLHNSTANTSAFNRLCFTFRVTHSASQYYSLYCKKMEVNEDVEISEEDHDYYMSDNWDGNAGHITGRHKGTYRKGLTRVTQEELEKILNLSYS